MSTDRHAVEYTITKRRVLRLTGIDAGGAPLDQRAEGVPGGAHAGVAPEPVVDARANLAWVCQASVANVHCTERKGRIQGTPGGRSIGDAVSGTQH